MGSSPAAGQARPAPDPPAVDREALESAVRDLLGALGEDVRREGIVAVSYTHLTLPTTPYV